MIDDYGIAELMGAKRLGSDGGKREPAVMFGTAVSDSADGSVEIELNGDSLGETTVMTVPTSPSVKAGDTVMITATGGVLKSPMVTSVAGSGDRLLAGIDGIETLIRETADGVLVAKVGQTVGALVNADGSFDVVALSWDGSEPTVTATNSIFADSFAQLGQSGDKHFEADYSGIALTDTSDTDIFGVHSWLDADGTKTLTETQTVKATQLSDWYGAGAEVSHNVYSIQSIEIDGEPYTAARFYGNRVCITNQDSYTSLYGKTATITYKTNDESLYLVFGDGLINRNPGNCSVAFGNGHATTGKYSSSFGIGGEASGDRSFTIGQNCTAAGANSFAGGVRTTANGYSQFVVGSYNVPDSTSLFIVGNGSALGGNGNALTVDTSGNLEISGAFTGNPSYSFANDNLCSQSASDWEQGGISSTGANLNRTHTIRLSTASRMEVTGGTPYLIDIQDGYTVNVKPYTSDGTFYEDPNLAANHIQNYPFIWVSTQDGYLRMTCTIDGSTALAPSGIETALPVVRKASAADFAAVIYAMELNGYAY